jgi:hypothetical protein
MDKQTALDLLGGTPTKAAKAIGIVSQAVSQWPDPLTLPLRDRVQAALYRQLPTPEELAQTAHEAALYRKIVSLLMTTPKLID